MTDEQMLTQRRDAERGRQARELLGNPLFAESFETVRNRLISIMASAKSDEATIRAKLAVGLLADLKQHLAKVITDGAMASATITMEVEAEEKKKSLLSRLIKA